ncbi:MAG: UTRA domain-containing protein [Rhodospirillales bacterium]|nr:UTRA domain-containing protein [Rhodospirillales bacterium]
MTAGPALDYTLDGDGPLYRQINRAIAQPILSGQSAPGTRLLSEHEFMRLFKTSRMTVNRALQMLADDGLVKRHRRNGTFVAAQIAEHSVMELKDIGEEIEAQGATYGYQLLERRVVKADAERAEQLAVKKGTLLLFVLCRHCRDDQPLLIEHRYINTIAAPACLDEPFTEAPPGHWLLDNIPWSRAEHIITAVNASPRIARDLDIQAGDACLSVERTTWQDGQRVTFVTLTYPGDKHRLVGTFAPGR